MNHPQSIRRMPRPQEVARMTNSEIRESFLVPDLINAGTLQLQFADLDRFALGGIVPTEAPLELINHPETGRTFFLEGRELGAINIGGDGEVNVDGKTLRIDPLGCIYIGMGAKKISFSSLDPRQPAKFFFLSCPAHAACPTVAAKSSDATRIELGSAKTANQRII